MNIANTFLRDEYLSHERAIACVRVAPIARATIKDPTRTRDVCRSNRLFNEMSAYSLLMEKYWMNVSSIVLLSKGRPVCSRWIAKGSYSDGGTRPSADGENTSPSRFNAKQAYSGGVSSAPDTDSWNINLMIEISRDYPG